MAPANRRLFRVDFPDGQDSQPGKCGDEFAMLFNLLQPFLRRKCDPLAHVFTNTLNVNPLTVSIRTPETQWEARGHAPVTAEHPLSALQGNARPFPTRTKRTGEERARSWLKHAVNSEEGFPG